MYLRLFEKVSSSTRSALMHDQVIKLTEVKVHVYTDSVLCLGMMQDHSGANQWMECSTRRISTNQFLLNYLESMENQLSSSGIFSLFQKIQKNLQDQNIEAGHFEGRILFGPK